jgi:hypothetical protein
VAAERRVPGGAVMQILAAGSGTVRIPSAPPHVELFAEGRTPGSRGAAVPVRRENGALLFDLTPAISGRWLYAVPMVRT